MTLMQMQSQHSKWLASMYPDQPIEVPTLGLVEEAGELLHVVLKQEQERLWGKEQRYSATDWHAKLVDAIGDCGIYVCSLCNAKQWDFDNFIGSSHQSTCDVRLQDVVVDLIDRAAKIYNSPSKHNLLLYISNLHLIARKCNLDLSKCILDTWEQVKQRSRA
jgi:NTP pyrophosphatase (non-canonical NTP hydrolase)